MGIDDAVVCEFFVEYVSALTVVVWEIGVGLNDIIVGAGKGRITARDGVAYHRGFDCGRLCEAALCGGCAMGPASNVVGVARGTVNGEYSGSAGYFIE